MNKVIVTAGMLALGAASLHAVYAPGLTANETGKPWSIAGTVRGFYDDNYNTLPDGGIVAITNVVYATNIVSGTNVVTATPQFSTNKPQSSVGFEVRPSFKLNLPLDSTLLTLRYTFSAKWYEDRNAKDESPWDLTHMFDFALDHAFSEIYSVDVTDSLIVSKEAGLFDDGGRAVRTESSNLHNRAAANFHAQVTDLLEVVLGYRNTLVDYSDDIYSARLDRMEHLGILNLRYRALPDTFLVGGYEFGYNDYTGDGVLVKTNGTTVLEPVMSDARDNRMHRIYGGADHTFTPDVRGSLRVGADYTDFVHDNVGDSSWNPYVNASVSYLYTAESSVALGVTHQRRATDVIEADNSGNITTDVAATQVYANLSHQFTSRIKLNAFGSWTLSSYNGGAYDGENETYWSAGVNASYQFNQYFSGEVGYTFDKVDSDVEYRGFDRNRFYVGLTAVY